ncbi:MAG TPA: RdgB/HAM1 family non-canonical purine NTP pyrophosphatase [Flexilinea sp.]|jgi:XTP/dITP diphosphohydrolase|nr:RdgB/HAM1 family non-canonical purine NTP pyrophosphatase [Flexilinea sp.]HQN62092.1 RdgB/HAM1 family non-canonical purine NTP pyrophosphatase [Flexilinea sp.]
MRQKILIATNNLNKIREIQNILSDFDLITPQELGIDLEIEENGNTFEENAEIKAESFCKASGMLSLADDSGLEVECLGGEPGVHSHRYCPKPDATDADRRAFLLENLKGKPRPWKARFYCAAALCDPKSSEIQLVHGICNGEIIPEERGNGGFGYDPIFWIPERGMTLAEMSENEKNEISHRGAAMRKIREILKKKDV